MVKAKQHSEQSSREARSRARLARLVLLVGATGFAALTVLLPTKRGKAIDRVITTRIQAVRDPRVERAMVAVSWLGFPPQSRLLPAAYAAALWIARFRLAAVFQLAAWGTALLSTVVKAFMERPRPVAGKDVRVVAAKLGGSSFPSGHVLTYVGVYGWMAITADRLIRLTPLRRLVVAALTSLIAAIGASRIYLGHHWPSDVFASYFLGSSYLAVLAIAYDRLQARRASR